MGRLEAVVVRVVAESPALEAVTTAAVAVAPATPPPPGATAASAIIVYPHTATAPPELPGTHPSGWLHGAGQSSRGGAKRTGGGFSFPCRLEGRGGHKSSVLLLVAVRRAPLAVREEGLRLAIGVGGEGCGNWGWGGGGGGRKQPATVRGLHVAGRLTC